MIDLALIMSVYHKDRLSFVKESVQSILDQTFKDFHYYLVFDGDVATDVDDYVISLKDERIRYYRLEKSGGLAVALNFLLEKVLAESNYRYIARMDADDISMPDRFEQQRRYLIENPQVTVVGSWYEEIGENGKYLSYIQLPTEHEALKKRYFTRTPFAHPSVMYRRELIEKAGYYPEYTVLMEDNVLWGKALLKGVKFANIPEYLLKFRIDKDFYKRRSGMKYGYNYIRTKFQMNRMLRVPFLYYPGILIVGLIKMLPHGMLKRVYMGIR